MLLLNLRRMILLAVCSLALPSYAYTSQEKETYVFGKVHGYENYSDHQTIRLALRDFFARKEGEEIVGIIADDGSFSLSAPMAYTQELYLIYGTINALVLNPGDSLYLEIDADILKDPKNKFPNGNYFIKFPDTELGKTNLAVSLFNAGKPVGPYAFDNAIDAEKSKSAEEYLEFICMREKDFREYLEVFLSDHQTTDLFKEWVEDHLKYETLDELMRYRWTHPYYNNQEIDDSHLPEGYFSFLEDYNMNDNKLFSIEHADFLNELSFYVSQPPKDKLDEVRNKNDWSIPLQLIEANTSGFTKELFFTKFYHLILEGHAIEAFEAVYDSLYSENPFFLEVVEKKYTSTKNYLANQDVSSANISGLKSSLTDDLIQTIAEAYQDKVIYVDFWAPWCGPCLTEMPYSAELQKEMEGEDVVFLFFGVQCTEESWKATIANRKLTGEHKLLTNDQYNILASKLGINGIPHYTLIDKNGKIVQKSATRPSNKEKLRKEIRDLLSSSN